MMCLKEEGFTFLKMETTTEASYRMGKDMAMGYSTRQTGSFMRENGNLIEKMAGAGTLIKTGSIKEIFGKISNMALEL